MESINSDGIWRLNECCCPTQTDVVPLYMPLGSGCMQMFHIFTRWKAEVLNSRTWLGVVIMTLYHIKSDVQLSLSKFCSAVFMDTNSSINKIHRFRVVPCIFINQSMMYNVSAGMLAKYQEKIFHYDLRALAFTQCCIRTSIQKLGLYKQRNIFRV